MLIYSIYSKAQEFFFYKCYKNYLISACVISYCTVIHAKASIHMKECKMKIRCYLFEQRPEQAVETDLRRLLPMEAIRCLTLSPSKEKKMTKNANLMNCF